jgi:hypothetical protein
MALAATQNNLQEAKIGIAGSCVVHEKPPPCPNSKTHITCYEQLFLPALVGKGFAAEHEDNTLARRHEVFRASAKSGRPGV